MRTQALDLITCDLLRHTLLEASAGTGKTYSLAHLVLRTIVECDIGIEQIILITFTRAATSELRGRIRAKLEECASILDGKHSYPKEGIDTLLAQQFTRWEEMDVMPRVALARILRSIENFDQAMIETTHGFCQQMLSRYSMREQVYPSVFYTNLNDQIDDIVERSYRNYINQLTDPDLRRAIVGALKFADFKNRIRPYLIGLKAKMSYHVLEVSLERGKSNKKKATPKKIDIPFAKHFSALLDEIRSIVAQRQRKYRWKTADDILLRTQREIHAGAQNLAANPFVQNIRKNFRAIFVDEFQDTDACQYDVLHSVFMEDDHKIDVLFFVGDPKQSIYAFRNSDIHTYLRAAKRIGHTLSLKKNFRSTSGIVAGLNRFFSLYEDVRPFAIATPEVRDDEAILFERVQTLAASEGGALPLVRKDNDGMYHVLPSFEIWDNAEDDQKLKNIPMGTKKIDAVNAIVSDITMLLTKDVRIYQKGTWRLVEPNDITILVRGRPEAKDFIVRLKKRLPHIGVTMDDMQSVLTRIEAFECRRIIAAAQNPSDATLLSNAMATQLMGFVAEDIATKTDRTQLRRSLLAREKARAILTRFADELHDHGPTAAFEALMTRCNTYARLMLSNQTIESLHHYEHLIRIMHDVFRSDRTTDWLQWFTDQSIQTDDKADQYRVRPINLEQAIHIVTLHSSKGLEYPIVYMLDALNCNPQYSKHVRIYHPEKEALEVIFSTDKIKDLNLITESINRSIRLGYVGLTRASRRLVIPMYRGYWRLPVIGDPYSRIRTGQASPTRRDYSKTRVGFARTFCRGERALLKEIAEDLHTTLKKSFALVEPVKSTDLWNIGNECLNPDIWTQTLDRTIVKQRECFRVKASPTEKIYPAWAQSSFSSVAARVTSDYEERNDDALVSLRTKENDAVDALAFLHAGPMTGNFLHKILELVPLDTLTNREKSMRRIGWALGDFPGLVSTYETQKNRGEAPLAEKLYDWLCRFARSRLFESLPALGAISRSSWRHEWDFILQVGWQKEQRGFNRVRIEALRKIFTKAPAPYNQLLKNTTPMALQGYLVGSMDAVIEYGQKLYLIDWKSNRLPAYDTQSIEEAMIEHQYHLQYLFYALALKRIIAMKYTDEREIWAHMGGIAYVFLRGGTEPITAYQPDMQVVRRLVTAIDTLFQS